MQVKIIEINPENSRGMKICGYNSMKQVGYVRKLEWLRANNKYGLKHKILFSEEHGGVGGIEYVPGEYAWRPVEAKDYLFIHCVYIVKKEYKGSGYGNLLVEHVINDAKVQGKAGVAVIARKGTWLAGREVFTKSGFVTIEKARPDFELMVYQLDKNAQLPKFKTGWEEKLNSDHKSGLTIYTSDQCPYLAKCNGEIIDTLENEMKINYKLVELKTYKEAQNTPCAYGVCCIINDGKVLSDKPASNSRFKNIISKLEL